MATKYWLLFSAYLITTICGYIKYVFFGHTAYGYGFVAIVNVRLFSAFLVAMVCSYQPVTDEQVFYDKFLCDKFYLLVCTHNFENFFYDKCTCSKASMLAEIHAPNIFRAHGYDQSSPLLPRHIFILPHAQCVFSQVFFWLVRRIEIGRKKRKAL
jgi:hypothetical protein